MEIFNEVQIGDTDLLLILAKKAIKGDKESFGHLITQFKNDGYRLAFVYLHNQYDSIDAVCNAIEKAWRYLHKLREEKSFKSWFLKIVANEALKIVKFNQSTIPNSFLEDLHISDNHIMSHPITSSDPSWEYTSNLSGNTTADISTTEATAIETSAIEAGTENHVDKMLVEQLLNRLQNEECRLVGMKFYLGYSIKEISVISGLPEGTVKTKIYGSIKKMRKLAYNES